jgi:glutaredoxin-like protein NrdH
VKVKAFTLSTCVHCRRAKQFLRQNNVDFEYVDVDLLEGDEKTEVLKEIYKLTKGYSFPVIIIGDCVLVGFNEARVRKELGL